MVSEYPQAMCGQVAPHVAKANAWDILVATRNQFDVSVNVTVGCPSGYGPSAVTVTCPVPLGRVSVTVALPEESVLAMHEVAAVLHSVGGETLVLVVESVPPVVVNRMLAPAGVAPELPTFKVTFRLNEEPVCASPVFVSVAAGFPTTIHPP